LVKVSIKAEEVLRKKIKPYGARGSHIIMPKKYLGKNAIVCISGKKDEYDYSDVLFSEGAVTGSWLGGYTGKKKGKKVQLKF
jgi:putative transposon-encoded protein